MIDIIQLENYRCFEKTQIKLKEIVVTFPFMEKYQILQKNVAPYLTRRCQAAQ